MYLGWKGSLQSWAFICREINKCLCSFKGERGERHNKQGQCAVFVFVCMWKEERESERGTDQSRGLGLCFWISVWEVKPHLPRMPCLTPYSPLRFLGAPLFFSSEPLHQSSPDILGVSWNGDSCEPTVEPAVSLLICGTSHMSPTHKLKCKISTEWLDDFEWDPFSLYDSVRSCEQMSVCPQRGNAVPSHTVEKPWKSQCCVVSVLRQCLSLAGWRKQSHWFLILIPFYCFSPIDHLSILNEMEGWRADEGQNFPCRCTAIFFHPISVCFPRSWGLSLTWHFERLSGKQVQLGDFVEVYQTLMLTELLRFA